MELTAIRTYREVADMMGITAPGVRWIEQQALKKIKDKMIELGYKNADDFLGTVGK